MNRKKLYRCVVILLCIVNMIIIEFYAWKWINRKIPEEIFVEDTQNISDAIKVPYISIENAIEASKKERYKLSCRLFGHIPVKEITVIPVQRERVYAGGNAIGIYIETKGVLVINTGKIQSQLGYLAEPAADKVQAGDYITAVNGTCVFGKKDIVRQMQACAGEIVTLTVFRNNAEQTVSIIPEKDLQGEYKLGIWIKDDTQGIGTLTFLQKNGLFGALGHGISDTDTGDLMHLNTGNLYRTQILGVKKGQRGNPGELTGLINYEKENIIGSITQNSEYGIFGNINESVLSEFTEKEYPIAYRQEVKKGMAEILFETESGIKHFDIRILQIDMNHENKNKSFIIEITDKELLSMTGGIVQGMSGSPIIQDGKIIGAVTHVFVNDPTRGYGIFIEEMLGSYVSLK